MRTELRGTAGFSPGLACGPETAEEPERASFPWQSIPLRPDSPLRSKHTQGVTLYPQDRLYQEMAFLAYYLHWSSNELMTLDHFERRRWCREVSSINKKLSGDTNKTFEFR